MTPGGRERKPNIEWKFWLGLSWMVFNLSLAAWWLIYGLRQIRFVQSFSSELGDEHAGVVADFVRQQRMLISEGSILMASLLIGGGALLYYITQERKRSSKIKEFFADFTDFPFQAGSSLNAGEIGYGLLQRTEAMKRLKSVEAFAVAGGGGR